MELNPYGHLSPYGQDRQGVHRHLVQLCLAVRSKLLSHAQASPAGAGGTARAGGAGLVGGRVRRGQVRHYPAQGGRLTPRTNCHAPCNNSHEPPV